MSRTAVITGTTRGIGLVTCRELAIAGYDVVMLCRDLPRAQQVREQLLAQAPGVSVRAIHCDLASLASVRRCAETVRTMVDRISLLINNAGMVSMRHRMSVDGFELTFAANHLGPFLLTQLLRERMAATGRIINVASRAHYRGKLALEQIAAPGARYRAGAAYSRSKLANVMFTFALARRLGATGITANCLHPGVVATDLLPRWLRIVKPLVSHVIDVERGARTSIHLALSDEVAGISGRYFDEHQVIQPASPLAADVEAQEQLWSRSSQWTSAPVVNDPAAAGSS
jgi:NAD(P)-dependent dehydrogenase (short-subunit alcohol dehydrogenase family)